MGGSDKGQNLLNKWKIGRIETKEHKINSNMNSICAKIPFHHLAILDSGTTTNLIRPDAPATDHSQKQNPIEVQVPNGDFICSYQFNPERLRHLHVF